MLVRVLAEHPHRQQFLAVVPRLAGLGMKLNANPKTLAANLLDLVRVERAKLAEQVIADFPCVFLIFVGLENLDHLPRDRSP